MKRVSSQGPGALIGAHVLKSCVYRSPAEESKALASSVVSLAFGIMKSGSSWEQSVPFKDSKAF